MKNYKLITSLVIIAIAVIIATFCVLILGSEKTYKIKVIQNISIANNRIENVNGLVAFINIDTKAYSIRSCTDSITYEGAKLGERYLILTKTNELNEDIYNRLYSIHKFSAYLQKAFDNNINQYFFELNDFVTNFILVENINARKALEIYMKLWIENNIYTKFFKDSGFVDIEFVEVDKNVRREFKVNADFNNNYFIFE